MPDRQRTLLALRRRDRADAIERLNRLLDKYDDVSDTINLLSREAKASESALERARPQGRTIGFALLCDFNHRQQLQKKLTMLQSDLKKSEEKLATLGKAIAEAKTAVAKTQRALEAIDHIRE